MARKTRVRRHMRRTKKGKIPVRRHIRMLKVKFSDGKKRNIPFVKPMRPKDLGDSPIPKNGWIAEEKQDGSLTYQYIKDGSVAYLNRRGREKTDIYPELTDDEPKKIKSDGLTIIQGETYAFDGDTDTFDEFLRRDLLQDPEKAKNRKDKYPLTFEGFDILMKEDDWIINLPLNKRKKILENTLKNKTKQVKVSPFTKDTIKFTNRLKKGKNKEGIIYKKFDSRYHPGGRHPSWKKNLFRKTADVVITGYNPGEGKRKDIGSLTAKIWDPKKERLVEVANVGTGFTDRELSEFKKRLDKGEKIFGKVEYSNLGSRNRLRKPSWKGERQDINIKETHL